MTETPEKALEDLLHDLFDADEFRVFLGRLEGGEKLHAALVGKVATTELLFSEAVRTLKRRGVLDGDFFAALVQERPKRKADIARVAQAWGRPPGEHQVTPSIQPEAPPAGSPAGSPRPLLKVRPSTRVPYKPPGRMGQEVHIGLVAWVSVSDGFNLHATFFLDPAKSDSMMGPNDAFLGRVSQTASGRWAYLINAPQLNVQHGDRPVRSREDAQETLLDELEEVVPGFGQNVRGHDESPDIRYEKFFPESGSAVNGMRVIFLTHKAWDHNETEKVGFRIDFGQPYESLKTYWVSPNRRRTDIDLDEEGDAASGVYMVSIEEPRIAPEMPFIVEVTSSRPWKKSPTVERWER